LLLAIPLSLSAFTHVWNPIGFPSQIHDESTYLRRSLEVLNGTGPQEPMNQSDHPYDHPYFGQLFLAGIFKIIGYPESLNPSPDEQSIEMIFFVPRVLMGIFAIADTFLIYKILERRYNQNVAFIAAVFFAVMPLGWFFRRIVLESIQLPFIFLSVLFAIYSISRHDKNEENYNINTYGIRKTRKTMLVLLSGIFLGLAIFTKIPGFTMIPLVGYLIFSARNNDGWKTLGLWIIPVILIPAIWPIYAIAVGELDIWWNDISWQTGREGRGLDSIRNIYDADPLIVILGLSGLVFAVIKRDLFVILWFIPVLMYVHISGWVLTFHLSLLMPAFYVSAAIMLEYIPRSFATTLEYIKRGIKKEEKLRETTLDYFYEVGNHHTAGLGSRLTSLRVMLHSFSHNLTYIIFISVAAIGFISTITLISLDVNSPYFGLNTFIVQKLSSFHDGNQDYNRVTLVYDNSWRDIGWIAKYVYDKDPEFRTNFRAENMNLNEPIKTSKVVLIIVGRMMDDLLKESKDLHVNRLQMLYNDTRTVATYDNKPIDYDRRLYPYNSHMHDNRGPGKVEVRANY
jgi:hypothetical protein